MSDKKTFEGDINRIKAWIHFKDRSDVDEDTQFLIDDIKLLFDMIAERDARIAKLLKDNVEADETIEKYFNKAKELESKLKQFAREASRVIEFYTHEKVREGYSEGFLLQRHRFDISCAACNEKGEGKTAREFTSSDFYKQVMEQIGETE